MSSQVCIYIVINLNERLYVYSYLILTSGFGPLFHLLKCFTVLGLPTNTSAILPRKQAPLLHAPPPCPPGSLSLYLNTLPFLYARHALHKDEALICPVHDWILAFSTASGTMQKLNVLNKWMNKKMGKMWTELEKKEDIIERGRRETRMSSGNS